MLNAFFLDERHMHTDTGILPAPECDVGVGTPHDNKWQWWSK